MGSTFIRVSAVRVLAAVGLLAPAAFAGVDPGLLALVMPDATILSGIQVSQAQSTPLGQYLLSQVQLDPNTNRILIAAGFDPRRDLREILAASGDGLSGLVLGRGSFQPAKISKAAVMAGAVSSKYRGVEMLAFPELAVPSAVPSKDGAKDGGPAKKVAPSVAFLDDSTVAAGDIDAVKAAIDRRGAGAVLSGQLAQKAREISVANDAWIATLTQPAGVSKAIQSPQLGQMQNLLQSAQQLSAGLKFSAEQVTLSAEVTARSPQDAQSMAALMKFLAGMLQTSQGQDSKSGPNGTPNGSRLPSIVEAARISSSGSVMYLILSVPEKELEQLFIPATRPQPKKVAALEYPSN